MPEGPSGFYGDAPAADPSGGSTDSPSNDDDDDGGGSDGVDGPPGFAGDAAAADVRGGATDYPGGDGYYGDAAAGSADPGGGRVEVGAGVVDAVRDRVSGVADGVRDVVDNVSSRIQTPDISSPTVEDRTVSSAPQPAEFDPNAGSIDVGTPGVGTPDQRGSRRTSAPDPATYDPRASGPGTTVSDVSARVDNVAAGVDQTVGGVTGAVTNPEQNVDTGVTDDLTTGGIVSESADSADGVLPGTLGGVNISEDRLQTAAETIDQRAEQRFEESEELTIAGSDLPDRVVTGAAGAAVDIVNVPGLVQSAETGVEVASNAPGEIAEEGPGTVGTTALGVGALAASATVNAAQENPARFAGGAGLNILGGAAAGRQLGVAGRAVRDRARTAGGARVAPEELAGEDVVRFAETDGGEGTRFPGADDPGLFQSNPAEAVRQQADEFTPDEIETIFGGADVDGETTLFKALDVEPEGPGSGRADTGFASAPGETLEDFDYETPGSFFGPELSPNFLGVDDGAGFSFRPGLPDTGNNPTAVAARTDVENPVAETLEEFNRELVGRAGETTARTKPAGVGNPGEIEAVVPPGAEFRSVGDGGVLGAVGSRAGVGSEVFTEIAGRRVPIRTVGAGDGRSSVDADAGDAVSGTGARSLDDISERVERPTDRPLAGFGVGVSSPESPSSPSTSSPAGSVTAPTSPGDSGDPSGESSGGTSSRTSGDSDGSSGGSDGVSAGSPGEVSVPGSLSTPISTTSMTTSTTSTPSTTSTTSTTPTTSVTTPTTSTPGTTPTPTTPPSEITTPTTPTIGTPTLGDTTTPGSPGSADPTPTSPPTSAPPEEPRLKPSENEDEGERGLDAFGDEFDSGIASAEEELEALGFGSGLGRGSPFSL